MISEIIIYFTVAQNRIKIFILAGKVNFKRFE